MPQVLMVSIHAPAWGATVAVDGKVGPATLGFNPRTRVGCDEFQPQITAGLADVSIHAPAWGATRSEGAVHQRG